VKQALERIISLPLLPLAAAYATGLVAFRTASQLLAFIPGKLGVVWRRAWYRRTLRACGNKLVVEWMSAFKSPQASVGDRVYVGPFCWVGWAHLGDDVMLASHVSILSGKAQHGTNRIDVPMRQQEGVMTEIHIGSDVWIGDTVVVMADIAKGTIVGGGSVVMRRVEDYSILAGNPARTISHRGPERHISP